MKEHIIDLTEIEEKKKRNPYPCDGCISGGASYGCSLPYTNKKTGHRMQKITSSDCHDDCQRYKDWAKREFHST